VDGKGAVSHPAQDLDDVVHQRTRLGILAVLSEVESVEFTYLQRALELTGGNLSRHLQVLDEAELVRIQKGYEGRRPRTWIRITRAGRRALSHEVRVLKGIVGSLEASLASGGR
jgi:DNA-binding MarR family transcriptional regulator